MKFLFLLSLFALNVNAEVNREWEDYSAPSIRGNFEHTFSKLPLSGAPASEGYLWASDYWARKKGSINRRWNTSSQYGFKLISPSRSEVHRMSHEQLAQLSASEKMDLLNGDYNYSLVREVDDIAADEYASIWHGICNGWAPASLNHKEPTPKTLLSNDGVQIPFGSSDIKALLSYYYAYHHSVESTRQMGKRCFLIGPGCDEDLNAGAFHIVLTNTVGIQKQSFIADVEQGRQVWNHAVVDYHSTIVNNNVAPVRDSAPGTVRRVRVKTDMTYVASIRANSWFPTNGTADHINEVKNYEYFLDLDGSGRIIGGAWYSKARPDFLWSMDKATSFGGKFSRLSELLND